MLVDAGGGSGRLVEKYLQRDPQSRAVIVDQSEAFLALAQQRLKAFGDRAIFQLTRLQDDWLDVAAGATAIVSMSAIHHLDPSEKQQLYRRCHDRLAPGGLFLNADEVRPEEDADYLNECRAWAAHMHRVMEQGLVSDPMCQALREWEQRNVAHFGQPRSSGDDCHETADVQCRYLRDAGFATVSVPWQKELWAILSAVKGTNE